MTLRVNVAAASLWIMRALGEFYENHPDIRLHLVCLDESPDHRSDDFDLEIRFGKAPWPGYECHQLLDECVYPVASPSFLADLGGVAADDLDRAPLLQAANFSSPLMDWRSWGVTNLRMPLRRFTTYAMVLEAAVQGHGIALGWHYYVRNVIAQGQLSALDIEPRRSAFCEYLVINPRSANRRGVVAARKWLLDLARREREPLRS